jgi:bifunctional non-homologous end joining protein LigD
VLKKYEEKRDFTKTAEPGPEGGSPDKGPLRFVVQQHAARRLHYDVRLELDGVLLSWAVPKGPSYNPADKHLAVHVEDHPFDYRNFEGQIPKGQYGGGEVIVWDEGFYSPDDKGVLSFDNREEAQKRMRADLKKGKLSITFRGHKLTGSWTIVKTSKDDDWLMIKHRDGTERDDFDVTSLNRSVKTGRTVEDIREGRPGNLITPEEIDGAVRRTMFTVKSPMAAQEAKKPFSKPGWQFELKIDGIRLLCHASAGNIQIFSRNGKDVTGKFPRLVSELGQIPAEQFILDGEVVCYDEDGKPSFQCLLERFQLHDAAQIQKSEATHPVEYCVFDLLYLDGWDLRNAALEDRRKMLDLLNPRTSAIRPLDVFLEEGELLFDQATKIGFEGVVGKKLDSRYREGIRSDDWLKIKEHKSDEFIVVGWLPGQGNRSSTFGSLILAEEKEGVLAYVGNVGGGFSDDQLQYVKAQIDALPKADKPFKEKIEGESKAKWVEPSLLAEVRYMTRTKTGNLRFPVFLHLRPAWDVDDPPSETSEGPQIVQSKVKRTAKRTNPSTVQRDDENRKEVSDLLTQLDNSRDEFVLEVNGEHVKVSSAKKVLWPATAEHAAVTKRDYLKYLAQVADVMIPHLRDRPLSIVRFPSGLGGERFFQKHQDKGVPDFVERVPIYSSHNDRATEYMLCNNLPTLLWLGQMAALEIHPWYSRVDPAPDTNLPTDFSSGEEALDASILNYPDFMVIDLDPNIYTGNEAKGDDPEPSRPAWDMTVQAALKLKEVLDSISLKGFLKTSGKTGLHVYVPIKRIYDYQTVRLLCETIGRHLLELAPELITMEWTVAKRPAKIFFDHNQNVRGKTLIGIYSPRPIPGAPVSFPITWKELTEIYPADFRLDNVPAILSDRGDLWDDIFAHRQTFAGYQD